MKVIIKKNNIIFFVFLIIYSIFTGLILNTDKNIMVLTAFFLPALLIAYNFSDYLLILMISLFFSLLTLPNLPERFNLYYAVNFLYLIIIFFKNNVGRNNVFIRKELDKKKYWPLNIFFFVIIITIIVRGFGIQSLGGNKIGGFAYIQILSTLLLIYLSNKIVLSVKKWRIALLGMCALALLPFFIEIIVGLHLISSNHPLIYFFQLNENILEELINTENILGIRVRAAGNASVLLLMGLFILSYKKNTNFRIYSFLIIALSIAGISGFRSRIIIILMFFIFYIYFDGRLKNNKFIYVIVSMSIIYLIIIFLPYMPMPVQRAFAWIPFAEISPEAKRMALGTSLWRIRVWQYALNEVPQYLLIGKGLSFSPNTNLAFWVPDNYEWAIRSLNYHNGPLSVLIIFGIFGIFSVLSFFVMFFKRHIKYINKKWHNSELKYYYMILFSFMITKIIHFLLIFGETNISLPQFFFFTALLEGLIISDKWIKFRKI